MKEHYQPNYWACWETCKDPELRRQKARKIRSILEAAAPQLIEQGGRALDVGCSIGVISEHLVLAWPHWEIVGVDIDAEALRLARSRGARLPLCVGDALQLPFPDAAFELVLCAQVYEHVPDWRRLLREIQRVLRPGGVCFFSGPNRLFPVELHYDLPLLPYLPRPLAHRVVRWSGKAPLYYERPVSWWTLRHALEDLGFVIEDYTYRLLEDPQQFHLNGRWVRIFSRWVRRLPPRFRPWLTPWMPNFNLVLRKPEGRG
ncbi:class I SAM-dependent methyltransferase [Thermoflexus sp.]|uniref:class I SAM-dependent methyltransferase n=1 Tax=Thermoflexus sp. TaxID=1969742 RepID=UPI0035E4673D